MLIKASKSLKYQKEKQRYHSDAKTFINTMSSQKDLNELKDLIILRAQQLAFEKESHKNDLNAEISADVSRILK